MKAQISSQVFMFILATVIIGAIIIIGTKSIVRMNSMNEKISTAQLQKNIEETFANIDYGDSKITSFEIPSKVREICFCGVNKGDYNLPKCSIDSSDEISKEISLKKKINEEETVFIILSDGRIESLKIPKLHTKKLICVSSNERVKIDGVTGGNILITALS